MPNLAALPSSLSGWLASSECSTWSSYPLYLQERARRPAWLRVDRLLGEWGIPMDSPAARTEFAGHMEARRCAEEVGGYQPHGWCLGSEEFREELLAAVGELARPRHTGEEVRQSAEAKALRIIQQELGRLGRTVEELPQFRKGEPQKVRTAQRLRRETTMSLQWIAQRLCMGAAGHVSCLLYRKEKKREGCGETHASQTIMDKLF